MVWVGDRLRLETEVAAARLVIGASAAAWWARQDSNL